MPTRQELERAIRARIQARDTEIESFSRRVQLLMAQALQSITQRLQTERLSPADAAALVNDLDRVMRDLGLDDALRELTRTYVREIEYVNSEFARLSSPQPVSGLDPTTIRELIKFDVQQVTKTINSFSIDAKGILYRSYVTGNAVSVSDIMGDVGDRSINHVRTELNTLSAEFSRTVTEQKAKAVGLDVWMYVGPEDEVTREFCEDVLIRDPPIYTTEEIDQMDNEQIPDVMTSGGGYNCRHQWVALDEQTARELGWQG
jgi:hypothetical protein